jgi:hypothetical protein
VKRTSGAKLKRRQGLKHKISDLFVMISIGGRTGLLKPESSRILKQKWLG